MIDENLQTMVLLQRWNGGDKGALNEILERDLPWIHAKVRQRLGHALRGKSESIDFVQDAMLEVLRYGPRFELANRAHFRGLMARIIENVLRGKHDWFQAQRRQLARERPLGSETIVRLDPGGKSVCTPSLVADRNEREARVRLAVELLEPEDREILILRQWQDLSFKEIADQLGTTENGARMRFNRTLPKVAKVMSQLDKGELEELLGESPAEPSARDESTV